jgi:hypothetical protein
MIQGEMRGIIIKWILNIVWRCGLDSYGSEHRLVARSYEYGNKHFGSIKGEEFLDWLIDYYFLKEESAPRNELAVS